MEVTTADLLSLFSAFLDGDEVARMQLADAYKERGEEEKGRKLAEGLPLYYLQFDDTFEDSHASEQEVGEWVTKVVHYSAREKAAFLCGIRVAEGCGEVYTGDSEKEVIAAHREAAEDGSYQWGC